MRLHRRVLAQGAVGRVRDRRRSCRAAASGRSRRRGRGRRARAESTVAPHGASGWRCPEAAGPGIGRAATLAPCNDSHEGSTPWLRFTGRSSSSGRPAEVWDALADVGALHTRLVARASSPMPPRAGRARRHLRQRHGRARADRRRRRRRRRVAWSVVGGRLTPPQRERAGVRRRRRRAALVWIADLLPDEHAPAIAGMIEQGLAAMKRHLDIG